MLLTIVAVTRSKVKRAPHRRVLAGSVTPAVDCSKVGLPRKECSICIDAAVRAECPEACPAAGKGLGESVT